jgi:hypothetical protein
MDRTWQIRRVVVTKQTLSFALRDDDIERDYIPLSEVSRVEQMRGAEESEPNKLSQKSSRGLQILQKSHSADSQEIERLDKDSTSRLFVNAFQIATIPDGHNSGRSYYLQAESSEVKRKIIKQLQLLTESARKRAEAKSLFRQAQDRVRGIYITWIFQSGAALLIVAVSPSKRRESVSATCVAGGPHSTHTRLLMIRS